MHLTTLSNKEENILTRFVNELEFKLIKTWAKTQNWLFSKQISSFYNDTFLNS